MSSSQTSRITPSSASTASFHQENVPVLLSQPPTKKHVRDPIYVWSSLVAGVGSGALSSVICAPLDLVRTRLQVWGDLCTENTSTQRGGKVRPAASVTMIPQMVREIFAKEGVAGCYRGLGATLLTVPTFWGVYFPLYDDLKNNLAAKYPTTDSTWIHMGSAVLAGAVSDVICNPMFVVRTRLQTEALHSMMEQGIPPSVYKPKSVTQTVKDLYAEGGLFIFWRGMTANLLGLSHAAVQFPVYERLKKRLQQQKSNNSAVDLLLASALSKMTASLLTYPHEVIRSRMMDARQGMGFLQTCRRIYSMEGIMGFYAGLPVTLLRVLPNTCIIFMSYEFLLQWAKTRIEHHRSVSSGQTVIESPPR